MQLSIKKDIVIAISAIIIGLCMFSFYTNAASTLSISVDAGDSIKVTLPKNYKFYSSEESNGKISSVGKNKSRSFTVYGIDAGTARLTVKTTKNKKVIYNVTVNQATPSDSTETQKVSGDCPHCKQSGGLRNVSVNYRRRAVTTNYLREPLVSAIEFRAIQFHKSLTNDEIESLVDSWHGVILSKYKDPMNAVANYQNYVYEILVPFEYSGLNKASAYQKELAKKYSISEFAVFNPNSLADSDETTAFYLDEWSVEDVVVEPARDATTSTGIKMCSKCGYKFVK